MKVSSCHIEACLTTETAEKIVEFCRRIQGGIGDVIRVVRMIERVMKAGTAARSAGYHVSYLDRATTEDSIHTLTNRVADWIFGTSNRQKGSREMGMKGVWVMGPGEM